MEVSLGIYDLGFMFYDFRLWAELGGKAAGLSSLSGV
jgi:hypothetical protein